ncbi:hypothetical protein HNR60_002924 [Rhodopseudomonas rhenobacensis]|uniref:Uncharacterized protein n=1 Tax=Rhodopseudomonas rhenobacensis TaxID=87461 RepID=A0A7W7Z606_9BRAD|nr:hypothetical protein [Rhodopseudomonas rhenobacensis]MBB5048162.1 hypothetical protein [Rhodopseudomonas rhenobacensis]
MAKKASKAKAKTKAKTKSSAKSKSSGKAAGKIAKPGKPAGARKPPARKAPPPIEPTYLAAGGSIRIGLHDVVRAIKMIDKAGQLAKFVSAAKRQQAEATLGADTVNFAKDFVVKYRLYGNAIGKHIVNGRGERSEGAAEGASDDPNQCHFGKGN